MIWNTRSGTTCVYRELNPCRLGIHAALAVWACDRLDRMAVRARRFIASCIMSSVFHRYYWAAVIYYDFQLFPVPPNPCIWQRVVFKCRVRRFFDVSVFAGTSILSDMVGYVWDLGFVWDLGCWPYLFCLTFEIYIYNCMIYIYMSRVWDLGYIWNTHVRYSSGWTCIWKLYMCIFIYIYIYMKHVWHNAGWMCHRM